uniref:LIM domain only protein 3 n=1 Tax=Aquila chrysaetos chrysaetos TaxID=223781 RepID=A0A663EBM9_AQUCH
MPLYCKLSRLLPPKTSLSKGRCAGSQSKARQLLVGGGGGGSDKKKESVVFFSVKHLQEYISFCISRLFGVTGNCAACSKLIPAFEMVMRAKDNVYHLDCFACQLCNQRFCVGDKFFLKNNMILCQTDYEEGLMKEGYAPQVR